MHQYVCNRFPWEFQFADLELQRPDLDRVLQVLPERKMLPCLAHSTGSAILETPVSGRAMTDASHCVHSIGSVVLETPVSAKAILGKSCCPCRNPMLQKRSASNGDVHVCIRPSSRSHIGSLRIGFLLPISGYPFRTVSCFWLGGWKLVHK
jgi:hypothetical protein